MKHNSTEKTCHHQKTGQMQIPLWYGVWFRIWMIVSGFLAITWLILRSGTKPSRFAYPCQRAALTSATAAFGLPLTALYLQIRQRWARTNITPVIVGLCITGLILTLSSGAYFLNSGQYRGPKPLPPTDYRAEVFHVTTCETDPVGERFAGMDRLVSHMGRGNLKFYESLTENLVSGTDGIIAAEDTVVIKINYQWAERGGTNTDLLRGLIWCILDHPDGFTGEIIVGENTQSVSSVDFNRALNNAKDQAQSPRVVVEDFQDLGYTISLSDWRLIRLNETQEYSEGDMDDGYVVYDYNSEISGRETYPKFQTDYGTYVSLRDGIWDPGSQSYDRSHLKFINVPVLKGHSVYGITAVVKHYMGVVTNFLNSNSHAAIQYGGLGAVMGEIQLADLNILDAIWVGAIPDHHPFFAYEESVRKDQLVAGLDPVALDMWAVKHILIPAYEDNGYSPPFTTADPDNPDSLFREYLDNSMYQILAAGYEVTNDYAQIDAVEWLNGDFDGDGQVDSFDFNQFKIAFTGPDNGPIGFQSQPADFDCDQDVDCEDWELFKAAWTGPDTPPEFNGCDAFGCSILMPSDNYGPGDACFLDILINNQETSGFDGVPLFVILEVYGQYLFAPAFNEFDNYQIDVQPGINRIMVLPEFSWPADAGNASGLRWYAAMTNSGMNELFGELDTFEFGWHE